MSSKKEWPTPRAGGSLRGIGNNSRTINDPPSLAPTDGVASTVLLLVTSSRGGKRRTHSHGAGGQCQTKDMRPPPIGQVASVF